MISIQKLVYNDELEDIVNKNENIYHETYYVKSRHTLNQVKKLMIKILNLKIVILLKYQIGQKSKKLARHHQDCG